MHSRSCGWKEVLYRYKSIVRGSCCAGIGQLAESDVHNHAGQQCRTNLCRRTSVSEQCGSFHGTSSNGIDSSCLANCCCWLCRCAITQVQAVLVTTLCLCAWHVYCCLPQLFAWRRLVLGSAADCASIHKYFRKSLVCNATAAGAGRL